MKKTKLTYFESSDIMKELKKRLGHSYNYWHKWLKLVQEDISRDTITVMNKGLFEDLIPELKEEISEDKYRDIEDDPDLDYLQCCLEIFEEYNIQAIYYN